MDAVTFDLLCESFTTWIFSLGTRPPPSRQPHSPRAMVGESSFMLFNLASMFFGNLPYIVSTNAVRMAWACLFS